MLRYLIATVIVVAVPAAVFAEEAMLVGSANPDSTTEEVASALATAQETPWVKKYDLSKPAMVSVFKVVYGKEGQRIQRLRGLAAVGLVGHAIDTPDACQLDEQQRDDAVALARRAAESARDAMLELERALKVAVEEQAHAQEAVTLNQDKWRGTKLVLKQMTLLHTAAHEAAHVVQQRAGVQLSLTLKNPTKANVLAYSLLVAEVQKKVDADRTAELALSAAQADESAAHQVYDAAVTFNLLKMEDMKRVRSQSTLASARLVELNAKASEAINAQIVLLAQAAVLESDELATTFDRIEATARAAAGLGKKLGGFEQEVPKAEALGNVMQANGSMVRAASEFNLLMVENGKKLPPIPPLPSEEEALALPQIALLDDLANAGEQQSIAEVMLATALTGGLSLTVMKIHEMSGMLEDVCKVQCGEDVQAWLDEARELQNLTLQLAMQNENRQYTTVSNVLKTKHDTVKNSINNVR